MHHPNKSYLKDINLHIIFSLTLVAVMGVSTITPVLPDIREDLGLTNQQVGYLIVFFSLPGIILTPLLGIFADRYGRKKVLVPSLLLFALAGFTCFFLRTYEWILFFRVLQGAGAASLGSLNTTLIGDIYAKGERAKVMGYVASVLSIGTATYPAIGGAMALLGWYYPFLLPLLALPVAWAILYKLNNPEPEKHEGFRSYMHEALQSIKSARVIALFVSSFVVFVILFGGYLTYLPLLMSDRFDASSLEIGLILTTMSLVTAITSAFLGKINTFINEKNALLIGFTAYVISFSIIPFMPSAGWLILPVTIFGAGHGINFPSIQSQLTKLAPLRYRGMFMSFNGMVLRLGQTTGPIIIGWFYLFGGHVGSFLGGAFMAFLLLIFLFFCFKIKEQVEVRS